MDTLKIDKTMVANDGSYTGPEVTAWAGHIEIEAQLGWVNFKGTIKAAGWIVAKAGSGIKAGEGIEAGSGIEAGWGIKAGWGIEAGWGIKAGLTIVAKWLKVKLRIFAGIIMWRMPKPEEMEIRAEVRGGAVAFGTVITPAKPDAEAKS